MPNNLLAVLPELILTITGVIIMMAEPMLTPKASRKGLGWLAIFGSALAGVAAFYQHRVVDAQMGASVTAFYGTLQVDNFSVFFHLLIAAILLAVLFASLDYFSPSETSSQPAPAHAGEYFALVCFGAVGMMLMTSAVELLLVFIGLEISSISTYILAGFRKGKGVSVEAALKYFLLGSFATAFFLYGIALAFGATGSTAIGALAAGLGTTNFHILAWLSVAMVLIGLGFKVSAAPFHVWTPDVYQGAPAPVVAMMSTAPKAAVFAVLLRILFNAAPTLRPEWAHIILFLSVASMCIGNLGALLQKDVKRLLAYSSIAHAGYLLAAFTSFHQDAVAAACFYTAAYAAMNVGAFLVIAQIAGPNESARTIDDFTGAALKRPYLCALLALFLVALIGIPFTGGFFGKFYIFTAAIHAGFVWLAIVGLANSGVACFYYLRLLAALYTKPVAASETIVPVHRPAVAAGIAATACALATLALGIVPGHLLRLLQRATPETPSAPAFAVPGQQASVPLIHKVEIAAMVHDISKNQITTRFSER